MTMTKAEKARMEELEAALALHWPSYSEPAPMTREEIEAAKIDLPTRDRTPFRHRRGAVGWFFNDYQNGQITKGWSDGISHNRDSEYADSASQNMGTMYRTKEDAAKALRLALSRRYAQALGNLDSVIRAAAQAGETRSDETRSAA